MSKSDINKFNCKKEVLESIKIGDERFNDINISSDSLTITGENPYIIYPLKTIVSKNKKPEYINFEIEYSCKNKPEIQIFWHTKELSFTEANSIRFKVKQGNNIINMGKNENWKNSEPVDAIRVDIKIATSCKSIHRPRLTIGN
ncbi:hypothetical protein [Vibrio tasmaniensis]|uniref:hypothetical protein n=1 Tax=Vibrio tasmaniensis TaxID=212663 RepID=UPI001081B007|nr:hypothetical protein [Vibrio tasmaniensis]